MDNFPNPCRTIWRSNDRYAGFLDFAHRTVGPRVAKFPSVGVERLQRRGQQPERETQSSFARARRGPL